MKYTLNKQFQGSLLISGQSYKSKPTEEQIRKMHFNNMTVSCDMLGAMVSNGFAYCPTSRKINEVKKSNYICVDVDGSTVPMDEYVQSLTDKPTIYYTTPSNGNVEKSIKEYGDTEHIYRFRLVYAISTPTHNAEQYLQAFRYIVETNNMQFVDERVANQYYNGSIGCDMTVTNYVYELPKEYTTYCEALPKKKVTTTKEKEYKKYTFSLMNDTFLEDILNLQISDFLNKYREDYEGIYIIHSNYIDEGDDTPVLYYPNDYMETPRQYYWDKTAKARIIKKWTDGDKRHKKIYIAGLVIKQLNEGIDFNTLVFALFDEFATAYDNTDGKFTNKDLLRVASEVSKTESIELGEIAHPNFKVKTEWCNANRVSKRSVAATVNNTLRREKTYTEIDNYYVDGATWESGKKITQQQWLDILKENGVVIGIATFKRYLQDRGYSRTNKKNTVSEHRKKVSTTKENSTTIIHFPL